MSDLEYYDEEIHKCDKGLIKILEKRFELSLMKNKKKIEKRL